MTKVTQTKYGEAYFAWQSSIGEFGGWANMTKFAGFIRESDVVLDFGCGGGYLLKNLKCHSRIGVEINPIAGATAEKNGVTVYRSTKDVPDESIDVIISNHALEHTHQPLDELRSLYPKLKKGGKMIIVVPCEAISYAFKPGDKNHHLYTWSPMCLGNLLVEAGYDLVESKAYIHKWPPMYMRIARFGGRMIFEAACRVFARIERSSFQVRAVATRPSN
jgi:SAM-dependent methyltransferase